MIRYYETLARSSESIRRGKVADETDFLITHEVSMNAFFHLLKKRINILPGAAQELLLPHTA
jgi:hypothetical protein